MPGNLIAQGQFTITDLTDTGIVATHVYYLASSSNNIKDITYTPNQLPATSSDWNQNSPKESLSATKKYLWQLIIFEYNDEPKYKTVTPSVIGNYSEEGTSISNVQTWYYYAISDDGTTPPDRDNIGDTTQNWVPNNWYESNNRGSNIPQTTPEYGYLWGMIKTTIYFTDNIADGDPGYPNQKTTYTYTVSSTADSVSVGGRNLLLHSGENELDGTEFRIARYQLAANLTKDTQYTLSVNLLNNLVNRVMNIDANGNPIRDENGDVTYTDTRISFNKIRRFINFRLESEDGKITKPWICDGDWISIYPYESTDTNEVNHIYTYTFVNNVDLENSSKAASSDADIETKWYLSIYAANTKDGTFNNGSNYIIVNTAQLEEGNVATAWRVAPEDLIEDTDELKDIIQKIYSRVEYCLIDNGQDPNNANKFSIDKDKAYWKTVPQTNEDGVFYPNKARIEKIYGEVVDVATHRNLLLPPGGSGIRSYGSHADAVTYTFTGWDNYGYKYLADDKIDWNEHVGEYLTYRCYMVNTSQTVGTGTGIMLHIRTDATSGTAYKQYGGGKGGVQGAYLASGEKGWLTLTIQIPSAKSINETATKITHIEASIRHNSSDGDGTVIVSENKVEFGQTATEWTPAPESCPEGVNASVTKVTNIGKNLISNSNDLKQWAIGTKASESQCDGSTMNFTHGDTQNWDYSIHMYPKLDYGIIKNKQVTLSFEAKSTKTNTVGYLYFGLSRTSTAAKSQSRTKNGNLISVNDTTLTSDWKKYTVTKTINDAFFTGGPLTRNDDNYVFLQVYNYTLSNVSVRNIQMEIGPTATEYSPSYKEEMVLKDSNGNDIKLYSAGNVRDELDLVKNNIIHKIGRIDLGTLNYKYDSSNRRFYVESFTKMYIRPLRQVPLICGAYTVKMNDEPFDGTWDMVVYGNQQSLYFHNHMYTDPSTFKASLQGVYLYYELANPYEENINLSANNVFNTEPGGVITFENTASVNKLLAPVYSQVNFVQGTREELDNFNNIPQILTIMPSIYDIRSSDANVLWQRTSTYIRTYDKVDNTDELLYHTDWEKVNLMNGIYAFLSDLTDGGFTTIDGGKITTNTIQAIGPGATQEWLQDIETDEENSDWYIYITNKGINLMYQKQQVGVFTGEMQTNADNSESLNIATAKFKADRVFASNVILRDNPDYDINIGFEARKNGHITLKGV